MLKPTNKQTFTQRIIKSILLVFGRAVAQDNDMQKSMHEIYKAHIPKLICSFDGIVDLHNESGNDSLTYFDN